MAWRRVLSIGFGILAAGVLSASCGVSPQPSPPDSILEGDLIGIVPDTSALDEGIVYFHAAAGTIEPPKGIVVITNLDTSDGPSFASVRADGSFDIAVPGKHGQSFRFQVRDGGARSQPFDVALSADGTSLSEIMDTPFCLVVDPARWIAFGSAGDDRDLQIHNQCSGALTLAAPHLRRGLAGFSFSPPSAIDLGAGEVVTITVTAGNGAEVEDILLLQITGPTAARRAITLSVPDP